MEKAAAVTYEKLADMEPAGGILPGAQRIQPPGAVHLQPARSLSLLPTAI